MGGLVLDLAGGVGAVVLDGLLGLGGGGLDLVGGAGALIADLLGGVWDLGPLRMHPLVLMYVASSSAMISKTLRIPKI